MIRNSIHTYDAVGSTLGNLPDSSILQVENSTIFIQVITKGTASTVSEILSRSNGADYIDLNIAERAGFAYDPSTQYEIGDLVTFNGITYYLIRTAPVGTDPIPDSSAFWGSQRTTNTYDSNTTYEPGEMIVIGDDIYVAPAGGIVIGDLAPGVIGPPDSKWLSSTPNERAGLAWRNQQDYSIGDSVYDNSVGPAALYICTRAHRSVAGSGGNGQPQDPASALNWTDTITADPGSF